MQRETMHASIGPELTPPVVKYLLMAIGGLTLFCALFQQLFVNFGYANPLVWFSLSWYSLTQWQLWKLATFLFVMPSSAFGITVSFLLSLAFALYILWVMGTAIVERVGGRPFLTAFFASGLGAGILSAFIMGLFGIYGLLSGPAPAILGILVFWVLLYPDMTIFLFLVVPLKSKWIIAGVLGAVALIYLSRGDLLGLFYALSGPLIAYVYGVIGWDLRSPFPKLTRLEQKLSDLSPFRQSEKIIKFRPSKRDLSDDAFMDAMLAKISKNGESSLDWWERRRMQKISERRTDDKS